MILSKPLSELMPEYCFAFVIPQVFAGGNRRAVRGVFIRRSASVLYLVCGTGVYVAVKENGSTSFPFYPYFCKLVMLSFIHIHTQTYD